MITTEERKCLDESVGWMKLGLHVEAREALRKLSPDRIEQDIELRAMVLIPAIRITEMAGLLDESVQLAEELVSTVPDMPSVWFRLAAALRTKGELERAKQILLSIIEKFPPEKITPAVYLALASILAKTGNSTEAHRWLAKTLRTGNRRDILHEIYQDDQHMALRALILELLKLWPGEQRS